MFCVNKSYDKKFPLFTRPFTIGYYSIDGSRSICFDSSQLLYFNPPLNNEKVNFDLNEGLEQVIRKPDISIKINHLLEWIIANVHKVLADPQSGRWLQGHFICFRGVLTTIMKTPYDPKEGWIICAAKFRGSIYLCSFETEAEKIEKANQTAEQSKFGSWGFKFEQYMLSALPNELPDTSKPVNESEEFCCVYRSLFVDHWMIYGAEVDGLLSVKVLTDPLPLHKLSFIELKTNRIIDNQRQLMNFKKFKHLRWWLQSFLAGIEKILCGFRDDKGIVRELKEYPVTDIPAACEEFWHPSVAMNFGDAFLKYISQSVTNNYDKSVYKFERIPYGDIVLTEVKSNSEYAFLPDWYTKSKT